MAAKEKDKKEKKEKFSKKMDLEELMAAINGKYGKGKIARASSSRALSVPRLETGVFSVDYATGGGLPIGRITGIYGKKSSGKTLLALKSVASAQRYCRKHLIKMVHTKKKLYRCLECGYRGEKEGSLCPDCVEAGYEVKLIDMGDREMKCPECKEYNPFETVWIDAEGAWENSWAQKAGVNCHHVYMIRTEFAEQAIDISDLVIRNGKCDLMVIDTIAHLIPMIEVEESAEKNQMGVHARLMNKMFRKLVSAQNSPNLTMDTRPTIIVLNQVRMKLGVMFGDPETKPGGMGQDFATSVDLKTWAGKYEKDEAGNTLNLITNFRAVKNKVAPPQQEGNFRVWLRDYDGHKVCDVEDVHVVLGQALKHKWFGDYDNEKESFGVYEGKEFVAGTGKYKEVSFTNVDEIFKYFSDNPDEYETLRTALFADMLGKIMSDEDAMKVSGDFDATGDDEVPEGKVDGDKEE